MIPVSIITGFLGSGKTTLLNHLVRQPRMGDTAVIVNEFGEIGIDHLLIEQAFEDTVLLENGCICCSIRGDLVDTLTDLKRKVGQGELPPFARAVVETTGLADPAPILQTLISEDRLRRDYALDRIVSTVDAVNAPGQLETFGEAVKQVAVADSLLITKSDLANGGVSALQHRLGEINANAPIAAIEHGKADPSVLFSGTTAQREFSDWFDHAHDHHHDAESGINSFAIVIDDPLPWAAVKAWLETVASLRGCDLLRVKGLLNISGRSGPVVVHGVQHVFHTPVELREWPDAARTTRIVFITRGLERTALENALFTYVAEAV
jgi:G3E family GTPase|tara:strand:- start:339 stop:1304 length:966 start_codon:yes stop_codon:yes gene_type:complete